MENKRTGKRIANNPKVLRMSFHLKSFIASACLATALGPITSSLTKAQTTVSSSSAHIRASGIPEKKPDGTWESLKPNQQEILAPLESDWDYMPPDSRKKWIQVSNIYPKMSPQDRERLQSRMASWSNLSQKDRRLARDNYLSSLKFPAEKKAEAWSAYQKLSDEQKKKLAESEVKKKPTATSAPTLQQQPNRQKPVILASPPAESPTSSSSSESSTSNN
jgi:hypothetical protein